VKFDFLVSVTVKNDALTRDAEASTLSIIIEEQLENSMMNIPWVLLVEVQEGQER